MKNAIVFLFLITAMISFLQGQNLVPKDKQKNDLTSLIDKYSQARERNDTALLKNILTKDVDQHLKL